MTEPGKPSHDVEAEKKEAPQHEQSSAQTAAGGESTDNIDDQPRQVIAVSASKGPAAFFNLARKFLVTDEYCDLSALEGAIVAAVDAAHLLERSKLASIVRVTTSYVTVEPKRKKQLGALSEQGGGEAPSNVASLPPPASEEQERRSTTTRELRRARIVITVRRTQSYKAWLEENPLQAVIAGDAGDNTEASGGTGGITEASTGP